MLSRDNIMVFFSISNVRRCGDVPNRAVPEGPHSEFPQSRFRSSPTCLCRNATLTDLTQRTFRGLSNQRCGDVQCRIRIRLSCWGVKCEARSSTICST
jgi:hypothetical protein